MTEQWHRVSKERRKEISARYYQRHRSIIKLAMTLDIPMKEARAIHAREALHHANANCLERIYE
jgi:hypothetical protein